ncbi:MAG TPA: DUF6691 family protein [Solirubrobacteraceae bacterium]|jgi:hypothetical protein|nr:DUF6691 family protein [Solirubrobacteraceae bacterium]
MASRLAGGLVGVVFGVTLSWTGMSSPDVIRQALLFESGYLYLFFASAVATAALGLWLLRAVRARALLTGAPIAWTRVRPRREHFVGSVIFGVGWALADACPGPVATQLGQGIWWSLLTLAGIALGMTVYLRRQADFAPDFVRDSKAKAPQTAFGSSGP